MPSLLSVHIVGGGPAGSSAAIAARQEGRAVCLIEKSRFPRHKVCGEFLSPEIAPILESLGVWSSFLSARPARIGHLELHFGSFQTRCKLPDIAYGLSRYRFDELLFARAIQIGAVHTTDSPDVENSRDSGPVIT
ncbi:MAG: tryptophan 7-halogenase, partial [Acidobacteriota bacterium]|nr:tryptophan 7-halogenase [Acidobacteriota bacterium]